MNHLAWNYLLSYNTPLYSMLSFFTRVGDTIKKIWTFFSSAQVDNGSTPLTDHTLAKWDTAPFDRLSDPRAEPIRSSLDLRSFIQYLEVTRSRSKNTVRNARSIIGRFLVFLENRPILPIDRPLLLEFLNQFPSAVSRYNAIYYLRLFLNYSGFKPNPAYQIPLPRINPTCSVRFYQPKEVARLMKVLSEKVSQGKNLRENAIIQLLVFTGLRTDEALSLKKDDLLEDGTLLIRDSKTHESRVTQVPAQVLDAIAAYHRACPNSGNPYVFYSQTGSTSDPLSYGALRAATRKLFAEAGLKDKNKGLHGLRHTFARSLVEGGFSREQIQALLGHKSIKTTEIYTRLSDRDVLKQMPLVHNTVQKYMTK